MACTAFVDGQTVPCGMTVAADAFGGVADVGFRPDVAADAGPDVGFTVADAGFTVADTGFRPDAPADVTNRPDAILTVAVCGFCDVQETTATAKRWLLGLFTFTGF